MNFINTVIGTPLGYLMTLCYSATGNYAAAIIIFTFISKIIMFPLNLLSQKNAIRMAKIKPKLDEVKRYYSGDKARIDEEQIKLYKSEKYNPFASLPPLIVLVLFVIGLISVIRNPSPDMSLNAWGVDLSQNPALAWSPLLLIPLMSAMSSFIMCFIQSKVNVLQREQSAAYNWGMTAFFSVFSLYFAFIVPAGVGLYWIFSNLFSIPVMLLVNKIYPPKKYIDYSTRPKPQIVDKAALKANRIREKIDIKRFEESGKKRLVFYSAKSGFYKYYKNVIEHILENSKLKIHYITSDPNDAIFQLFNPRIIPYYIGEKALIPFMLRINADMVVMTAPDLHKYHIKRSMARKDIEYVYIFHAVVSTHMQYREGAFDHYDTIFCVGQYHIDEIRAAEKKYKLPPKNLVPCGYGLIDDLIADYEAMDKKSDEGAKKILIAPSWQRENIMESCLDELLEQLLGRGYHIVVRPHPEFTKRFPEKMDVIIDRYRDRLGDDFIIETDFSSNVTIFTADLLITDRSGIAFEYSYATKRPCLQINTPQKILNPNYKRIKLTPVEISMRDTLGVSVDLDKLDTIAATVESLFANADEYSGRITEMLNENLFCIGNSGEVGGQYIIQALKKRRSREVTDTDVKQPIGTALSE